MIFPYLTLSDSAKVAQAAKNILTGEGYKVNHVFFDPVALSRFQPGTAFYARFLPFPSYLLSLIFKLFPSNDITVITSGIAIFIFSAFLIYLLGRRLHSQAAGVIGSTFFLTDSYFLKYATNFASELIFSFFMLLSIYLATSRFKKTRIFSLPPFIALFFTRPQAWVFLASVIFFFLLQFLLNSSFSLLNKLKVLFLLTISLLVLWFVSVKNTNASFLPGHLLGSLYLLPQVAQGNFLRGASVSTLTTFPIISKLIYNIYNFLKSPERLASPILIFIFLVSLFYSKTSMTVRRFHFFSFSTFVLFIIAASLTLPNARYVHPITPLVFISSSIILVEISKLFSKNFNSVKLILCVIFITLPTLGDLTLDARFRRQHFNIDKPPTYKVLSDVMAKYIPPDRLVITNLDAWAAWYHNQTTMWFPLSPKDLDRYSTKVEYILITNYLENDPDFSLGQWESVVYQPNRIESTFLNSNFRLLTTFVINPSEVYENQEIRGTVLINYGLRTDD